MKTKLIFTLALLASLFQGNAQVGIGTETPHASSILDVESTTQGVLLPRMTTAQRDAIASPLEGLHIYNTTNNSTDVYSGGSWKSFSYSKESNLVYVYSLADLPTPASGGITLDETKMYVFSGNVDISPNYININGAGLRGTDPQKDRIISNVTGAVLRSTDKSVYIKELAVIPATSGTTAYNFSDTTGNFFCNIFSGCSVVDALGPSAGVGTISGFEATTILQNYWNTTTGVKITGNVGKFTSGYNFIVDITSGAGIELASGANIQDVDIANNYFIYPGNIGLRVDPAANVDRGRLTANMFRGVTTPLDGITFFELGWSMLQNTNISDSRAVGFLFFNGNTTATTFNNTTDFVKITGASTSPIQQKVSSADGSSRFTYDGRRPIVADITASINGESGANGAGYTIAISKNGQQPAAVDPINTLSGLGNGQRFQLSINTNLNLVTGDYIEVFIRSDAGGNQGPYNVTIGGLQFNVND